MIFKVISARFLFVANDARRMQEIAMLRSNEFCGDLIHNLSTFFYLIGYMSWYFFTGLWLCLSQS